MTVVIHWRRRPPRPDPWRRLTPFAALLATVPLWHGPFDLPSFADWAALPVLAAVLVAPVAWCLLTRHAPSGPAVDVALVASVAGWAVGTRLGASWAVPPTADDMLRGHLVVVSAVLWSALWRQRRAVPPRTRSKAGLALLGVVTLLVGVVPAVGGVPTAARAELLPLPAGVTLVAERAGCESSWSCERAFELAGAGGVAEPRVLVEAHLRARGWGIGEEHQDKACRPLGYVANPYRFCVTVLVRRDRGTVEVLFDTYNPAEPVTIWK